MYTIIPLKSLEKASIGKEYRMAIKTQNVILIKCCFDSCKIEKRNFFQVKANKKLIYLRKFHYSKISFVFL